MKSYQQSMDHTCGAACVRTVLNHFGLEVPSEKSLAYRLKADFKTGIDPRAIERYLTDAGLVAHYRIARGIGGIGELKRKIVEGWTPIICWADWGGHYCVVIAYESDPKWSGGKFTLADPAAKYEGGREFTEVSADRLKTMWSTPCQGGKQREVIYVRQ